VRAGAQADRRCGESDNDKNSHVLKVPLLSFAGCKELFYGFLPAGQRILPAIFCSPSEIRLQSRFSWFPYGCTKIGVPSATIS
jgi:hypothetical protein